MPTPDNGEGRPARAGFLLVNLGTPESPSTADVRRYLAEFLADPRVVDLNPVLRWLLLHFVILPFRPARSARAYRQIWTGAGSPLLVHGRALAAAVAARMGEGAVVELAMRYGRPSIDEAMERLAAADVDRIAVLPLFPQYSAAAWGSAAAAVMEAAASRWDVPAVRLIPPFHAHPGFLAAWAAQARPFLGDAAPGGPPDRVLFSFHGLPERHLRRSAPDHCLRSEGCCAALTAANRTCYRAQCFATARALARSLDLADDAWEICFQSRMGTTPWIRPHTDVRIRELAAQGARRLVVLSPAFVADCLETLEEIGVRARREFEALGGPGSRLDLVPSLNATDLWANAVADLLRNA